MKPHIHAEISAKRFGGLLEDYVGIHELMDSSKTVLADSRHRALTHHSWFIETIVKRIYGNWLQNSHGKKVSVSEIAAIAIGI